MFNKYVVSYLSLNVCEIDQKVVSAQTKVEALQTYIRFELGVEPDEVDIFLLNENEIYELIHNWDSFISVIEVS